MATQENTDIVLQRGVHHLLRDIDGVTFEGTNTIPTFTIWNCIDNSVFEIPNDTSTREFFGVCMPTDTPSPPTIPDQTNHEPGICKAGKPYKNTDDTPRRSNFRTHAATPLDISVAPASHVSGVLKPVVSLKASQVIVAPTSQGVSVAPASQASGVLKPIASWKDDKAVKYLLTTWKDYKEFFDSTTMRNEAVWCLIAGELVAANNTWVYSGPQCENKFKDVRKSYVKVRDHNNQTGVEPKTCKFYDNMESILGDKPCVKPVAVASNLKKRAAGMAAIDTVDEECPDNEGVEAAVEKRKKKTRVQRELDEWNRALRVDAQKREEAREKRHLEGIDTFKEVMSKLIDKL